MHTLTHPCTPSRTPSIFPYTLSTHAAQERAILEEFDLRPAEATQRDYSRVLRAQAAAIKGLTSDVNKLKQSMEFQLASLTDGLMVTKSNVDDKSADLREVQHEAASHA